MDKQELVNLQALGFTNLREAAEKVMSLQLEIAALRSENAALQSENAALRSHNCKLCHLSTTPAPLQSALPSRATEEEEKRELCSRWQETGACYYGNLCQFAHGFEELQPVNCHPHDPYIPQKVNPPSWEMEPELPVNNKEKFKTELCRKWRESRSCDYGNMCRFAHGLEELRPAIRPPSYKTELCRVVRAGGHCPYGDRCNFRHAQ